MKLKFNPATNGLAYYCPQDNVITEIDNALLNYEKTVAVASGEGVDVATKEVRYEWTYVQGPMF